MRISAALKSIIHGITTKAKSIANPLFLKQQLNMRTDSSTGLRKRPPTEMVLPDIIGTFDPATDWVKRFILRQTTYFLIVKLAADVNNPAADDIKVVDENGNLYNVNINIDSYKYLVVDSTRTDIQLNVHGDTVFITNKTKTTAMTTDVRSSVRHTLIHVKSSPLAGETILIYITGQDGTQYPIGGSSIVVGAGAGANAVEVVASQIAALVIPGLVLSATGATVKIVETATNAPVTVQLSNTNQLLAIGDEVESTSDLPRNAPVGKVVGVRTIGAPDETVIYLRADLDATSTASVSEKQGTISLSKTVLGAGAQFTQWSVASGGFYSIPAIGTGALKPFRQRAVGQVYISYQSDVAQERLIITVGDIDGIAPSQALSRVVFADHNTGAIVLDVTVTKVSRPSFLGPYNAYMSTGLVPQSVLEGGKLYDVYFNLLGSLSTGTTIETVLWRETSKPGDPYIIDGTTMPMMLTPDVNVDTGANQFNLDINTWERKQAGNSINNPVPPFIDSTISGTAIFQNRLVILSKDNILTSETDNTSSLFRNTVSQLLSTHPVNIRSTASDSSPFVHAINHNKDLMISTENAQYKLDGKVPITPQTAGLPQVSSYSSNTNVQPVSLGNKVYYGFLYGRSTGIAQYSSSSLQEIQEEANSITDEVKGFISTNVELITGDASTGVIIVADRNGQLYVCDHDTITTRAEEKRFAWSLWDNFRSNDDPYKIEAVSMTKTKISMVMSHNSQLDLVTMEMDQDSVDDTVEMYLDNQGSAVVDGSYQITLPTGYLIQDNTRLVHAYGEDKAGLIEPYTVISPTVLELVDQDPTYIGNTMSYGTPYQTSITPQFILGRDEGGKVNSNTNIRVLRWNVFLNNSADVYGEIETPFATVPPQYWSGLISGDFNSLTDNIANSTSIFKVSFKQRGDTGLLHITSESHLPLNITEIEYIGNYITRGRRF